MWNYLYTFIALTTLAVIPNAIAQFSYVKSIVFIILGLLFVTLPFIKNKGFIRFSNKWIAGFFIYFILSFGYFYLSPSIGKGQADWSIIPSLMGIISFLIIKTLVESTDKLDRWIDISKFLCWFGFGIAVYAILQFFGLDQMFPKTELYFSGPCFTTFGNSMLTANFLACISPLCLIFKERRSKLIYAVLFVAVCLCKSELSLGVFALGLLLFLFLTNRRKLCLALSVSLVLLLIVLYKVNPLSFSLNARDDMWWRAIEEWRKAPWTGHGFGSFYYRDYVMWYANIQRSSHCILLDFLHNSGIIGVTLILGYLISLVKRIFRADRDILLIGLSVSFFVYCLIGLVSYFTAPMILVGLIYISGLEVLLLKEDLRYE